MIFHLRLDLQASECHVGVFVISAPSAVVIQSYVIFAVCDVASVLQRKMKMQAMFMEDDVVETTDVDDVRYNMRKALRANQVTFGFISAWRGSLLNFVSRLGQGCL